MPEAARQAELEHLAAYQSGDDDLYGRFGDGLQEHLAALETTIAASAVTGLTDLDHALKMRPGNAGQRRGRGKAAAADVGWLYAVARACTDTLAGDRDKALVLTGFHYASRSQDPAGLLGGDVALRPRGLVVSVLTGRTRHRTGCEDPLPAGPGDLPGTRLDRPQPPHRPRLHRPPQGRRRARARAAGHGRAAVPSRHGREGRDGPGTAT
ncbi:hypothetical protein ACIA5F_29855, partial [Streptomyces sp. NPDC051567]